MREFTATFHSHFGAVRFSRTLKKAGISCALRPVPRALSSAGGTFAVYRGDAWRVGPLSEV